MDPYDAAGMPERNARMFAVRFHGRGGQGVVTAAELLSVAAFHEGKYSQAFPTFGSERTGAPVMAFCRIADVPIRAHDPITKPDALVIQDPTLMGLGVVLDGLTSSTHLLVNTSRSPRDLALGALAPGLQSGRVVTVPASEIARRHLGRPLPNAALLGALAAMTGVVALESVMRAIRSRFSDELGEANAAAAVEAHDAVMGRTGEYVDA